MPNLFSGSLQVQCCVNPQTWKTKLKTSSSPRGQAVSLVYAQLFGSYMCKIEIIDAIQLQD